MVKPSDSKRGASLYCPLSQTRALARVFVLLEMCLTYVVYLDEFGHIGPYISRTDPRHNDSPVFGLAGFALPIDQVRGVGTWFFQRKQELLAFEINRAGQHPAVSEKIGGRPGLPLCGASQAISLSSQTNRDPRLRNAALYLDQFVVR